MERDTFIHLCMESEAGRDAFVVHPSSREEGLVTGCSMTSDHLVVRTAEGRSRCWDYRACDELRPPLKAGPMG